MAKANEHSLWNKLKTEDSDDERYEEELKKMRKHAAKFYF